jgi:hypothetical protein
MSKKITLVPKTYYAAVKACNGDYLDEKRFDRLAGLSWITKYTFEVVDEKKWESFKKTYKVEVDKQ